MQDVKILYKFRERLMVGTWISFAQFLFEAISIWFRIYKIVKL